MLTNALRAPARRYELPNHALRQLWVICTVLLAAPWLFIANTLAQAPNPSGAATSATQASGASGPAVAIQTQASHLFILDPIRKQALYCLRCDEPMPPASMSKLMTMLIVMEKVKDGSISMDTEFTVSEKAWRLGAQSDGSHMFLELGSKVKVSDLVQGVIVVSANDACIVLAEGIAGTEDAFVALMNMRAKELGLSSASFRNVTGLPDPQHLISARDLASIANLIMTNHPDTYRFYSERSFTYNNHTQENRNPLLGAFEGADGVKTGHTEVSGFGLVGSASRNGERRIIVVNGLLSKANRSAEANRLMRIAFSEFKSYALFDAGEIVGEAPVWLGSKDKVTLQTAAPIGVSMHISQRSQMRVRVVFDAPIPAPIAQGAIVGKLVVDIPGIEPKTFPLVATKAVPKMGMLGRAIFAATHSQ